MLTLSFVANQELMILRCRRVLDQGENRWRRAALGAVDVRRFARLVHWVHWRFPTDCQIHPSLWLLAAERGPEQMTLCLQRRSINVILSLILGVSFAAGRTRAISFLENGVVHPVREWLMLQVFRV